MANSNLAIRFTDEVYATRSDVAKSLGTNLIDSIWVQIINYRKTFMSYLSLKDINKYSYYVTLTSNVLNKCEKINSRIEQVFSEFDSLKDGSIEKETFRKDMMRQSLRHIAKVKNIIVNDIALDNIIAGRSCDLLYEPISRYYSALTMLEQTNNLIIDESLIAKFLEILEGGELTSFYRENEISAPSQKVLINREYNGAPTSAIESMMENLIVFLNDSNVNILTKIAGISFAMNYIMPFENYNEEMTALLIKSVIQKNHKIHAAALIPMEILLIDTRGLLSNCSKEAQKNNDLTYYVIESAKMTDDILTLVLDRVVTVSRDATEKAFYSDEPEVEDEKVYIQPSISNETKPVVENKKPAQPANNQPKVNVKVFQELDEKALKRAAEDLLESDPTLRPSQAHFYVRHCTMGKYYTIQQFKQCEKCVYETARTSMDNLARAGYYRREQVKNKFVYTPITKE